VKLVILDRGGVINRAVEGYVLSPEQVEPLPGSLEAIARLHHAGFRVAVATNQAPLSRGLFDMAMLNAINQRMCRLVEAAGGRIDAIAICPHSPEQDCNCRKPRPGMLLELIDRFGAVPAQTTMIGDTPADVLAGLAAGCDTWLVRSGHGQAAIDSGQLPPQVQVCNDLADAVPWLLGEQPAARPPEGGLAPPRGDSAQREGGTEPAARPPEGGLAPPDASPADPTTP
jgi:D-glycero-D-manno-heptose 1,7-bisphosphate phosphatase